MKKRNFLKTGYDIVVFDCDSTLTEIEGIDLLAKWAGKEKLVKVLTDQAMNGKMKFEEVFPQRLSLINPKKRDLERLANQYIRHQIRDAKGTIQELLALDKKVYIVTGGYEIAVKRFARFLGLPSGNVFAVELRFGKNEDFLGYNSKNALAKDQGKRKVLKDLKRMNENGTTIFVGDGATDLTAKEIVDLFVGFGGVVCRPIVQQKADIFINFKSLIPIVALAKGIREK